jgi:hypothetical protein
MRSASSVAGVTTAAAERFFERLRTAVGLGDRPGACALTTQC